MDHDFRRFPARIRLFLSFEDFQAESGLFEIQISQPHRLENCHLSAYEYCTTTSFRERFRRFYKKKKTAQKNSLHPGWKSRHMNVYVNGCEHGAQSRESLECRAVRYVLVSFSGYSPPICLIQCILEAADVFIDLILTQNTDEIFIPNWWNFQETTMRRHLRLPS